MIRDILKHRTLYRGLCQAPMIFVCRATAPVAGMAGQATAYKKIRES